MTGNGKRGADGAPLGLQYANLLGVLDRARLANHGHLDLTGILHRLLDLARDLAREPERLQVIDLTRANDDADLTTRLDGVRLLDPIERPSDLLETTDALDIVLQALTAGARAGTGDGIRSFHQDRLERLLLCLVVV